MSEVRGEDEGFRGRGKACCEWGLICKSSGYVALAVSSPSGTYTREVETGLAGDREGNMVAFAVAGLELLKEVVEGKAKL